VTPSTTSLGPPSASAPDAGTLTCGHEADDEETPPFALYALQHVGQRSLRSSSPEDAGSRVSRQPYLPP